MAKTEDNDKAKTKGVNVEIPRPLHESLKAWCEARGFKVKFIVEKAVRKVIR